MSECRFVATAVPGAGGHAVLWVVCQTHNHSFPQGAFFEPVKICPIGQIEEARDRAIAEIQEAKSQP